MNALTTSDLPQVTAIGGRVAGLLDIIQKLRELNLDMSTLMRLVSLVGEIGSAPTTKEKVVAALEAIKIVSEITPTEADDKIVAAIATVLSGKTLDILCNLVDSWLGNRSLALAAVESEVTALNFNWTMFMELAKIIVTLIRSQQGK